MELFKDFGETNKLGKQIYSILFQDENYYAWMAPSQFLNEMQMSTEERMERLRTLNRSKASNNRQRRLKVSPEMIVFQNYQPEVTQTISFSVMNTTEKMLSFRVVFEKTEVFQLHPEREVVQIAPGMKTIISVLFTPLNYKDYLHKIILEAMRDTIILPIICIGPRPLLSIPDRIVLETTPVKKESKTTFTIANIGVLSAILSLKSTTYFSISPQKVFLPPGDKVEVSVSFKTSYPGNIEEDLLITLESGEQLISKMLSRSVVLDVSLHTSVMDFPKAYLSLPISQHLNITNNSQHVLEYAWMKDNTRICGAIAPKKGVGGSKAANDMFMFSDKHFSISPISGEIQPFSQSRNHVTFTSGYCGRFHCVPHCHVTGLVECMPLTLTATCIGPTILLEPRHAVVDLVFGKECNITATLSNQGDIDGEMVFKHVPSNHGTIVDCHPPHFTVKPGEAVQVNLTVTAKNPGPYVDEVHFQIQESREIVVLTLKGVISSPKIRIEPSAIAFGDVAIGFKVSQTFNVRNLSDVAIDFHFKIPTDGKDPTYCADVQDSERSCEGLLPSIVEDPKEFSIVPVFCTLYPMEGRDIELELVPSIQRQNNTFLEVSFHDSESNPIKLGVTHNAICPSVVSLTPSVALRNCFLRSQVISTLTLQNLSNVRGYFYTDIEPKNPKASIECNILPSEGVFEANQQFCLDVFMRCNVLGNVARSVSINVLGLPNPLTICQVQLEGIGPTVSHYPKSLSWGEVSLLSKATRTLKLSNLCPIDATFKCYCKTHKNLWDLNIKKGTLRADDTVDIIVSVFLQDADTHSDKLIIEIQDGKSIVVPLHVKGINSCIVMEPVCENNVLDFGKQLTFKRNRFSITLKNFGSKTHQIKWSVVNELLRKKDYTARRHFSFAPEELKLSSMENCTIDIQHYSETPGKVEERWFLFGVVEYGRRELLKEVVLAVEYVRPSIEMSRKCMSFQINRTFNQQQFFVLDYVYLKNTTTLDLNVKLATNSPFQLVCEKTPTSKECLTNIVDDSQHVLSLTNSQHDNVQGIVKSMEKDPTDLTRILRKFSEIFNLVQETSVVIEKESNLCVNVLFNENILSNKKRRLLKDVLDIYFEDYPIKESIGLVGEINTPDIELSPCHMLMECKPSHMATTSFRIKNVTPLTIKYHLLYHHITEKTLAVKVPPRKIVKKKTQKEKTVQTFIVDMIENRLYKSIFCENYKHYDEMENIIKSIVNLLPNYDGEETEFLHKRVLQDPRKNVIENLVKTVFIENLIFNTFWNYYTDSVFHHSNMKVNYKRHDKINNALKGILSLNRSEGELLPFDSHEITALFKPSVAVDLNMKMVCLLEYGPSKSINIQAVSGEVQFVLSKDKIDYGVCLYHELRTETIVISNSGCLSFDFFVSHPDETELFSNNTWQSKILEVSPNSGKLMTGQSLTLFVKVNPGIFGQFEKFIKFNMTNYKPVVVPIVGLGTFPQVDFVTDYSYKNEIPLSLQYSSISNISEQWLSFSKIKDLEETSNTHKQLTDSTKCICQEKTTGDVACKGQEIIGDDWVVISDEMLPCKHSLPSLTDIKFTIERSLVSKQLSHTSNMNAATQGNNTFYTFKRFLDVGIITYDQTVKKKIELVSYSFCSVGLKLLDKECLPVWLKVSLPKVYSQDSNKNMLVTVLFASGVFEENHCKEFTHLLRIQVVHGAIIPIEVKAKLTIPTLYVKHKAIEFGSVMCGDIKVCSLPIVNCGIIPCSWSASILPQDSSNTSISLKKLPYHIVNPKGCIQRSQVDYVRLYFRPKQNASYSYTLHISVEHSPSPLQVLLTGSGLPTDVSLIGASVVFPASLPHLPSREGFFGICNPHDHQVYAQFYDTKRNRDFKTVNHKLKSIETNGIKKDASDNISSYQKIDASLWSECETLYEKKDIRTFIICHQTGFNESIDLVKILRNGLDLPVVTVDSLLLHSIAAQETEACTSLRRVISQTYMSLPLKPNESSCVDRVSQLEQELSRIYSHYFETGTDTTSPTNRKTLTRKTRPQRINFVSDHLSSASSCEETQRIFNFSTELLEDVLRHSLSNYKEGCIISEVNCMFIESQCQTLQRVLKCLPSTASIHLTVAHHNINVSHNTPSSVKANEVIQKKLRKLLGIAENWDVENKCVLVQTKMRRGKVIKRSKDSVAHKRNKQESSYILDREIGIKSWLFLSKSRQCVDYFLEMVRWDRETLENASLKGIDHCMAEYVQIPQGTGFRLREEPFTITPMSNSITNSVKENSDSSEETNCENKKESEIEISDKDALCGDVVMIPGKSLLNVKVSYQPNSIGCTTRLLYVATLGSCLFRDVVITGYCDLPRISEDPYVMFPHVIEAANTVKGTPVYDAANCVLNFGSMFCKGGKESSFVKEETITLKNISNMDADIHLALSQPKGCVSLSCDSITVPVKQCGKVSVSVRPKSAGSFRNTLVCCLRDNPCALRIPITGVGVQPAFTISHSTLEFGKMLLYRQESKSVCLTNSSSLAVWWCLRNVEQFRGNLFVSRQDGVLEGMTSQEVKFLYGGNRPMLIRNGSLHVDVYEKPLLKGDNNKPRLLLSRELQISLECYDVLVDCIFHPHTETHINLGRLPVGASRTKRVGLVNRGNYQLVFKIVKSDASKVKLCVEDVTAKPSTGLLKPKAQPTSVEVTWKATFECNLCEYPVLNCHLIDVVNNQKTVAMLPLNVSVLCYFNQ